MSNQEYNARAKAKAEEMGVLTLVDESEDRVHHWPAVFLVESTGGVVALVHVGGLEKPCNLFVIEGEFYKSLAPPCRTFVFKNGKVEQWASILVEHTGSLGFASLAAGTGERIE